MTESLVHHPPALPNLSGRVRARCQQKGWDILQLAQRAVISPNTLHQLLAGRTRRPHLRTIARIAGALEVSVAELCSDGPGPWGTGVAHDDAGRLDRITNPIVTEIAAMSPELFRDWSVAEWDSLYSAFGTGGPLTASGVSEAARRINRRRETVRRLRVVLETHLEEVAEELVDALYRQVRPASNLAASPELDALLSLAELSPATAESGET